MNHPVWSMASTTSITAPPAANDYEINYNHSSDVPEMRINTLELETRIMQSSSNTSGGVFLTWEDLWVTVSIGKRHSRSILQGVTGYARPGELLAIMGPSGCGKSTLLDALAGRLDPKTRQSGDILINGHRQALAYGTSAYVTQDDALITTLTVREAVYYSAQLQLPSSMSKSEKKERAEMVIKEMGLQDAMNTRIGGWGAKGLSGGQKRRVSICIEILTRPKLLVLDEPTSGLDSAASYYVMSRIARQREGKTIIASIHQPSAEVFSLFQNVCLLSSGRTIYFGPNNAANGFFAVNGFPCPTPQNPSDHFLKTINKDFDEDIEEGSTTKRPTEEVIGILINSYKSSDTYKDVRRQVSEICMNARGSMLMFVVSFLTFMAIGGFSSFVEEMKVFQRERLNGHYDSSAFVVGNTLSALPYLVLVSLIPGAIAYYLTGLQKGLVPGEVLERYTYFTTSLLVCTMLVERLMMIVASLVPNFLMGIIAGAGIQGLMMLGGGFFRLPNDLPTVFWKYPLYYVAFHKYAYQGLLKNEFEGRTFPNHPGRDPQRISGETILRETFQVEMDYSKWVDIGILLGMVVLYRLLFLLIVNAGEKIEPGVKALMSVQPKQARQITATNTSGTIPAATSPSFYTAKSN